MPPDGGGKGHFTSMSEMRAAIIDHEKRLRTLELDLTTLTDAVMKPRKKRASRKRSVMKP